jgi:transcriptional regulator with XRE-family HTH domain
MPWSDVDALRLGRTLRRLRHDLRLSQESLAFGAGITKNQVQLLEYGRASGRADDHGRSNPRLATLVGLAEALGVSVADLLRAADL